MEKCMYQARGPKHGAKNDEPASRLAVHDTEDRLRGLEEKVQEFINMSRPQSASVPANGYDMQAPSDLGQYQALVGHLQELRSIITGNDGEPLAEEEEDTKYLLGSTHGPSLRFILHQYLPDRSEVEAYLGIYFRAPFLVVPILHGPTFQKELNNFWLNKPEVDPTWVGLLFAVLTIAVHINNADAGNDMTNEVADKFTLAAAECIKLGGFTRPRKHLIPAMLLFAQGQYVRRYDPSREARHILVLLAELTFQSNLHREPGPNTSVLEAEYARRQFFMVRHFELQIACQFGVPSAITPNLYSVHEPRNLFDQDLTEDLTTLPEARPMDEATPITSFLIKARLMRVFSEVYKHAVSVNQDPDIENITMKLDAAIKEEHRNMPQRYKIKPIAESYTDAETLIIARLTFEFLAQKSILILHRRRMNSSKEAYARKACIDAISTIIKHTVDFYNAFDPQGQLPNKKWMLNSTIINDFLLATTCLCVAVSTEERFLAQAAATATRRRNPNLPPTTTQADADRMRRLIDLLTKARQLCINLADRSRGAARITGLATLTLTRLQQNANVDPSLAYPGINLNGFPSAFLPTPAPSSTMSQERSSARRQGGYDYAANIAAAAQAEPLPVGVQSTDQAAAEALYIASRAQAEAAAQAAQPIVQGQGQAVPMGLSSSGQVEDPLAQFSGSGSGVAEEGEFDWNALDQFILSVDTAGGFGGQGGGFAGEFGFGGAGYGLR
jgi:hypothetical protein